ncbi:transporter substrate-binding domain-containing protein [Rhizobium sp. PAMB 3182]
MIFKVAPLKTRGKLIAILPLLFLLGVISVSAEEFDAPSLPLLFNAHERLEKPDLSLVPRIRFLTSTDFPPFNFIDPAGRLSGFNIDLARAICTELAIDAKCQVEAIPFSELSDALAAGEGEAVIAGVAVTPETRRQASFTRPYMLLPARFAVQSSAKLDGGDATSALNGKPVGVISGSAHEAMLKAFFPDLRPRPYGTRGDMLRGLEKGEVPAVFSDGIQLPFWTDGPASKGCCKLFDGPYYSTRFLGEGLSIMTRRKDQGLAAAFDYALASLSRDGKLQDIFVRYFPYGL